MSARPSSSVKALRAWGDALPTWVARLAQSCDTHGLRRVAAMLSVSPAMVSLAINNKRENWHFIKSKVENSLMISILACPVLGVIGNTDCQREQIRPFTSTNTLRVQLYRACRNGCKHYNNPKNTEENCHVA